jgi:hypothetical protein
MLKYFSTLSPKQSSLSSMRARLLSRGVRFSFVVGSFSLLALLLISGVAVFSPGSLTIRIPSASAASGSPTVTLSAPGGAQGSSVTVTATGLSAGTYTVCFSAYYNSCNAPSQAKASYSESDTALSSGVSLVVPDLYGGQYFVDVFSGSTFEANAIFTITSATVSAFNAPCTGTCILITSGYIESSIWISGHGFAASGAGSTYSVCFSTSTTSCSSSSQVVTGVTGATLSSSAGLATVVPIVPPGPYYIDVSNGSSGSYNIVATTSFFVNGSETLSTYGGIQGSTVTLTTDWAASSDSYSVCFSPYYNSCSAPSNAKATYTETGTALNAGVSLTVPDLYGGQYFVDVISGSTLISNAIYAVTPAVTSVKITGVEVNTAGIGSSLSISTTNLATSGAGSSYDVCISTQSTSCSGGETVTGVAGSTITTGYTLVVPDIPVGQYYVDIGNGTSNIISAYSLLLTGPITLSSLSGGEGSSVTITAASLAAGNSYTVCFSEYYSSCSSVSNAKPSYTLSGSALTSGASVEVPNLPGGQYFVDIISGSTVVDNAIFSILPSVVTLSPDTLSSGIGGTITVTATNLNPAQYYIICLDQSEGTSCSNGLSTTAYTGSTLGSTGGSLSVATTLTAGQYYVSIHNQTILGYPCTPSCSLGNLVDLATLVLTGTGTSDLPISLSTGSSAPGGTVTVTIPSGLTAGNTYPVCFSSSPSSCTDLNSAENGQVSTPTGELGSTLTSPGATLTVPDLPSSVGGITVPQYYIDVESGTGGGATIIATASFSILPSTLPVSSSSGGIGSSLTIDGTNLVSGESYVVCFSTSSYSCNPASSPSEVGTETGTQLSGGVSIIVPNIPVGNYYLEIVSGTTSSPYDVLAESVFGVTGALTLASYSATLGSTLSITAPSLNPSSTYVVCFSSSSTSCNALNSAENGQVPGSVSSGLTGTSSHTVSLTVPDLPTSVGGISVPQYFVDLEVSGSTTVLASDVLSITPATTTITTSSISLIPTGEVGSSFTLGATSLNPGETYIVCFSSVSYSCNPASSPNEVTTNTGSNIGSGILVTVPNIPMGKYYLDVVSGSASSPYDTVAMSTFLITGVITPGINFAGETAGGSVGIQFNTGSLSSDSYTVCFSSSTTSCSALNSAENAQVSGSTVTETGSALTTGANIPVPDLPANVGGISVPQYFINLESGSTVIASATLSLSSSVETLPASGSVGSSVAISATNLNLLENYLVCFSTSSYECNPASSPNEIGGSLAGSALYTGSSITVPSITTGIYYVDIVSGSGASPYDSMAGFVFSVLSGTATTSTSSSSSVSISTVTLTTTVTSPTTVTSTVTETSPVTTTVTTNVPVTTTQTVTSVSTQTATVTTTVPVTTTVTSIVPTTTTQTVSSGTTSTVTSTVTPPPVTTTETSIVTTTTTTTIPATTTIVTTTSPVTTTETQTVTSPVTVTETTTVALPVTTTVTSTLSGSVVTSTVTSVNTVTAPGTTVTVTAPGTTSTVTQISTLTSVATSIVPTTITATVTQPPSTVTTAVTSTTTQTVTSTVFASTSSSSTPTNPIVITPDSITAPEFLATPAQPALDQFQTFSGSVATFTDSDGGTNPSAYSATINWGDGGATSVTPASALITYSNGQFIITSSHRYFPSGSYTVTINVADGDGASSSATTTAVILPSCPISLSTGWGYSGTAVFLTGTGCFGGPEPTDPITVTLDYPSYSSPSTVCQTVQVQREAFDCAFSVPSPSPSWLSAAEITVLDSNGHEGVAAFDVVPSSIPSGYVAQIGKVLTVTLYGENPLAQGGGTFCQLVGASNCYFVPTIIHLSALGTGFIESPLCVSELSSNPFVCQIQLQPPPSPLLLPTVGSITFGSGAAAYTAPIIVVPLSVSPTTTSPPSNPIALTANSFTVPITSPQVQPFLSTVASFTDTDGNINPSEYSATINWGDGVVSGATITYSNGQFIVSGSHGYSTSATYSVTIEVRDKDFASAIATVRATVEPSCTISVNSGWGYAGTPILVSGTSCFGGSEVSDPITVTFEYSSSSPSAVCETVQVGRLPFDCAFNVPGPSPAWLTTAQITVSDSNIHEGLADFTVVPTNIPNGAVGQIGQTINVTAYGIQPQFTGTGLGSGRLSPICTSVGLTSPCYYVSAQIVASPTGAPGEIPYNFLTNCASQLNSNPFKCEMLVRGSLLGQSLTVPEAGTLTLNGGPGGKYSEAIILVPAYFTDPAGLSTPRTPGMPLVAVLLGAVLPAIAIATFTTWKVKTGSWSVGQISLRFRKSFARLANKKDHGQSPK